MTMVIPFPFRGRGGDGEEPVDAELVSVEEDDEDDFTPSRAREAVVAITSKGLPSRQHVVASTKWWTRQSYLLTPYLIPMLLAQYKPMFKAIGVMAGGWARFVMCPHLAEAVKEAQQNERSKATERLVRRRTVRGTASAFVLLTLAGGGTWIYLYSQLWFWSAIVALAALFVVIGRRLQEPEERFEFPIATTPPWTNPAVSLAQMTRTVVEALEREGFEPGTVQVAKPMWVEDGRMERRVRIKTSDKLEYRHIEAIEIALGAPNGAIRNLATDNAAVRELVMRFGDPLADVSQPDDHEPLSRTITQPLRLGESSGDRPFAVKFAGLHTAVIGKTGSGKSKSMLNSIIDEMSVCRDAVLYGIDLQGGPIFTSWKAVIQGYAEEPEDALVLLEKVQREIDRRMKVLQAIVEDDDPDNDTDEWHAGLGPHLFLIIDEFAVFAEQNGARKKDGSGNKVDLMGPLERIIRTGRKTWVTLILATQKAGTSDFGSTVISSQCANKILMACENEDVNSVLGKALKEQGWQPHLFSPAEDDNPQDAGKAYVYTPTHRTPDIYRSFAPLKPSEIRRRAKARSAAGLPTLSGRPAAHEAAIDAPEIPGLLAAIERVFTEAGRPEWMTTAELMSELRENGFAANAVQIADAMRISDEKPGSRRRVDGVAQQWGYELAAVEAKIRSIG